MRTVKTKKINDIEIVVGFDRLYIDPMASRRQRSKYFTESEEWIQAEPRLKALRLKATELHNAKKKKNNEEEISRLETIVTALQDEVESLKAGLIKAKEKAHEDGTVLFSAREGEYLVEEPDLNDLCEKQQKLKHYEYLTIDGNVITYIDGMKFWRKTSKGWEFKIPEFGQKLPAAWAPETELSLPERAEIQDQIERNRIAALSAAERAKEKKARLEEIALDAVKLRMKFEIQKTKDPLKESQDWYDSEVAKIEEKYR